MRETRDGSLSLTSLNHISIVCRSVEKSIEFYWKVLGFIPIRRPGSLNFTGAWLFNYGIGIHLLQSDNPELMPEKNEINPRDNHISFQCESMEAIQKQLSLLEIPHVMSKVEEGGIIVDQLFFHDPDGFMIEICNCENLPVISLTEETTMVCKRASFIVQQQQHSLVTTALPPPSPAATATAVTRAQ